VKLAALLAASLMVTACSGGCRRSSSGSSGGSAGSGGTDAGVAPTTSAYKPASSSELGAPRTGMAWIPPGTFRAGTPPEETPRVADEEMAGVPVEMGGYYIDVLPYPNEPNAIPTSNVTQSEASLLCAQKGKRLCTELEWERACKGPDGDTYGYKGPYRGETCGTGVPIEQAALRPTGEHRPCKNGYGVAEMHGGVWEWTSSSWGRGGKDPNLGVLRGGNSVAGELVGRCANAIGRKADKKQNVMGLRCCAGPKNAAEVKLELSGTPGIEGMPAPDKTSRAWKWIPVANEELVLVLACSGGCTLSVRRGDAILLSAPVGKSMPELARIGDAKNLRIRSLDQKGTFSREITYVYGRVELGEAKRP
jgi:sulfatase modifying factor 1